MLAVSKKVTLIPASWTCIPLSVTEQGTGRENQASGFCVLASNVLFLGELRPYGHINPKARWCRACILHLDVLLVWLAINWKYASLEQCIKLTQACWQRSPPRVLSCVLGKWQPSLSRDD